MKKIIIVIFLLLKLNFAFAWELDVKANIDSWTYNFVLEVFLITSPDKNKSFYYTDWIWRYDNLIEFKKTNPIIINSDTILNYYAIWENYESTKIKENNYKIVFSSDLDISFKDDNIILKNNSLEVQNIWYWLIKAYRINYQIPKNTFLEANKTFTINYRAKDKEVIKLISPDNKIEKKFVFEVEQKNPSPLTPLPKVEGNNKEEKIIEIIENFEENTTENFDLNSNLKTSIIDNNINGTSKKENNNIYILLIVFMIITFIITLYNIYLVVKSSKTILKYNSIKNKSWKK